MKKLLVLMLLGLNAIGAEKHWLAEKCKISVDQIVGAYMVRLQHPTKTTCYTFLINADNSTKPEFNHSTVTGNFELFSNYFNIRFADIGQLLKTLTDIRIEQVRLLKLSELGEVGGVGKFREFDTKDKTDFSEEKYFYQFNYGLEKDKATEKLTPFIATKLIQHTVIPALNVFSKTPGGTISLKNGNEINQFVNGLSYIQKHKEDVFTKCIKIKKLYE